MTLSQKRALRFGLRVAAIPVLMLAFTAIALEAFDRLPMGDAVMMIGRYPVRQAALLVALVAVIAWAAALGLVDRWVARRLGLPAHGDERRGD